MSAADVLENDEMADQVQKPPLLEYTLKHDLKLWKPCVCEFFAFDGPPGHKPFTVGSQRADARLEAVRDYKSLVEREQRGICCL